MSPERVAVLVAVYQALGTARLQASMPAPHAVPYLLRKAHEDGTAPELTADSSALLRCIDQLVAGAHGEPMTLDEAQALLVATVRAKVAEHAKRDDDFKVGKHATIGALVVKANFSKWIAAGRAWLEREAKVTTGHKRKSTGWVAPWEGQTGPAPTLEAMIEATRKFSR